MKDVNQYRDEMTVRISAEVMQKLPELMCEKMNQFEIAYDDKIAECMIDMYTEGLTEGLSRATQVMQSELMYKATKKYWRETLMNDIRELTDPIAKKNGKEVISVVAIEECSELQKEITKMMRERGNKMNLLEEMADVYICLAELRQCYGITDHDLNAMVIRKITRTYARKSILSGPKE